MCIEFQVALKFVYTRCEISIIQIFMSEFVYNFQVARSKNLNIFYVSSAGSDVACMPFVEYLQMFFGKCVFLFTTVMQMCLR